MESFNHQLLSFLPKRIHFHTDTFNMRMNFAVMDWVRNLSIHVVLIGMMCLQQNENISRPSTSERMYMDLRRPDRRTPRRLLVQKTFENVHSVWALYMERNMTSERYNLYTVYSNKSRVSILLDMLTWNQRSQRMMEMMMNV